MIEENPITTVTHFDIGQAAAMILVIAFLLFALVGGAGNVAERYLSQAAIGHCVATMDKVP